MFDAVFISYREINAEQNWARLQQKLPHAMRLHGINGLHRAHIVASNMVKTNLFYVIDGDAVIDDDFMFDYQPNPAEMDHVHVFRARNPVNDLVYGYGAVKLLPTCDVRELANRDWKPDMTTSINRRYKVVHQLSNVTAFNTDDFNSWRSAFRECVKLSSKVIDSQVDAETVKRLDTWCSVGYDRPFGISCLKGARDGVAYGKVHANDLGALLLINDSEWLVRRYVERYA